MCSVLINGRGKKIELFCKRDSRLLSFESLFLIGEEFRDDSSRNELSLGEGGLANSSIKKDFSRRHE